MLWRRVLGLGVEPNLLVEGTRDESTRIKTLLMIFKVEIVASHKKGKQHVVHMIQKRLYNSDNDFHKVRMRFANKEGNEQMNVNFNCNFTRFNHFSCNSYYLTHTWYLLTVKQPLRGKPSTKWSPWPIGKPTTTRLS